MTQFRIGIDLGGTKIEGIALGGSREIARIRVPTPRGDYAATVEAIATMVAELERSAGNRCSVGIGIPGTLAPDTNLVKNANSVWLIGRPLRHDVERTLQRDVRIANDANCFAVSEAADGAAVGADVVFGVIAGTGVGGGVVVRGHLLTGPNGVAGEWGHNPLPWATHDELAGAACYCGKHGCIETFLSGPGMMADHERRSGRRMSPSEIVVAAADGDPLAEETLATYERRMARALAGVINLLDPDVIVLGGGMSNVDRLYRTVPARWSEYVFGAIGGEREEIGTAAVVSREPVRTKLVRAAHGDSSGVRGAAWLWSNAQA